MTRFIELKFSELWNAANVGVIRRMDSMYRNLNANKHASESNWRTDIEGAIAEACFAKFKGMYWACGVGTFKEPDVGRWQVRSTRAKDGCLIVRENDRDDDERFAFLVTNGCGATLVGWMTAGEAREVGEWRGDAWWVSQDKLHGFDEGGA